MQEGSRSIVLWGRRLSGRMLTFMLKAEDDSLRERAELSKEGRAGKTLVKQGALRITLVALKKGTVLRQHRVPGPVSIQTIRGCLRIITDKGDVDIPPGGLVALDAGVVHTAKAHNDCTIMVTVSMP